MLTSGELPELQPLSAWARHLGIPDPLIFLDDELATADTEGMRDTAREVWGTANTPSRHAQEAAAAMETLHGRVHNSDDGWAGRSQREFTAALEADQTRLQGTLDRLTVLGDASTRVADGMETAYTNAMIACLRASAQVAEIAARDPERTPRPARPSRM